MLRMATRRIPGETAAPPELAATSARFLVACSAAKDVMATLEVLTAAMLKDVLPLAREEALLFSPTVVKNCTSMMETLALEGNPECMVRQGQILQNNGNIAEAKEWYQTALEKARMKFNPRYPHPMALPLTQPWIALHDLLSLDTDPEAKEQAKAALKRGALEADDPLAYYRLAEYEDNTSATWLRYMSKAAASGHLEAAYKVGQFYSSADKEPSKYLPNPMMKDILHFALSWRSGSVSQLGRRWFEVAAAGGFKPALVQLVKIGEASGDEKAVKTYLRQIAEPPADGSLDQWHNLAQQARRRLEGAGKELTALKD